MCFGRGRMHRPLPRPTPEPMPWKHGVVEVRIDLHDVAYSYRRTPAVAGVDWSLSSPGVVGLLGPNGAGKTTLIRLLATVLQPRGGSIKVSGVSLEQASARRAFRESLGYLPQEFGYWPSFTALECVAYVGWLRGMAPGDSYAAGRDALELIGLTELSDRRMRTLSGGQKRRVGIAQAIVNRPGVLLLDEPTAGLDPERRVRFRQVMQMLGAQGIVLVATHLVEDVATACDRLAIMRTGRIEFEGTPSELSARGAGRTEAGASEFESGYLAVLSGLDS
jgi:ABC-2 type transport system ATP-binding protein